jgi:ATP-dependent exoDNAse (exonuclease V) beta subunit
MTKQISDLLARQNALNPHQSYIVQAPAGSGKTELLTQRFLKLLAHAEEPESIIALTFTQKAAAEMKERILSALEKIANNQKNSQPQTDLLAIEVLKQDSKCQWKLLQSPHRLRVKTIDSLCAELVGKMPLLSKGVPYASIEKDSTAYYQEAAERCLMEGIQSPHYQQSIETLLLHRGNHYIQVIELLAEMLKWRDQWLPLIGNMDASSSSKCKQILEEALKNLKKDAVIQLETFFPYEMKEELRELCEYAEKNLPPSIQEEDFWMKALTLLLTKENTWRAQVNKTIGFPSVSDSKNKEEQDHFSLMKQRLTRLLSYWHEDSHQSEACRLALENYRKLPPIAYSETQWKILEALITLLPLLAAQLKAVFMETGKTDFSEISEQASDALGRLNEPTDLALYCDYAIKHLLIDEFQDTSLKQFILLEKLTQGWEPGDGRTLFVVGDPMQSIYRFRQADVSLFLQARKSGIGSVSLKSLLLTSNFRSHPILIHWVNQCFKNIFPREDDFHLGAVKHHSSDPGRENYSYTGNIIYYRNETSENQGQNIAEIIKNIPSHESIGLLIHSRKQLNSILPSLEKANIAFQGIDIDPLSTRTYIQDLCSLTQTLLEPANLLAWYATLRAPWCGLTLSDLLVLSQQTPTHYSLSSDGAKRFQHVQSIITQARHQRQKTTLSLWVENTWRALGGHLYTNAEMQQDIEAFWSLLDNCNYEQYNLMDDLLEKINNLYSNLSKESNLQIMTIHKSKGLEFDHVILPHLEAASFPPDTPLLQHIQRKTSNGDNNFLLAAVKSVEVSEDPTYQYLKYTDHKKEIFEKQRLLYVALTRAKSHLHLFAIKPETKTDPTKNSFLAALMPHLPEEKSKNEEIFTESIIMQTPILRRFPNQYFEGRAVTKTQERNDEKNNNLPLESPTSLMQIIGTFIHEQIQYCAENQLISPPLLDSKRYQSRLIELGVYTSHEQAQVLEYAKKALNNIFQDPRGQWILNAQHQDTHNEYAINYLDANQQLQTAILDRTFLDTATQTRWIIDYKITQDDLVQGTLSPELAPKEYRAQLEHYGRLLSQYMQNTHAINLGLYYPITQTWIEWKFR